MAAEECDWTEPGFRLWCLLRTSIVEPHSYTDTVTVSSGQLAPRNGTLVVPTLSASAPSPQQVDVAFQCPNPNWEDEVTAVNVTGFTYTLTFVGFTEPAIIVTG